MTRLLTGILLGIAAARLWERWRVWRAYAGDGGMG